jgi:hypothetical protein
MTKSKFTNPWANIKIDKWSFMLVLFR